MFVVLYGPCPQLLCTVDLAYDILVFHYKFIEEHMFKELNDLEMEVF